METNSVARGTIQIASTYIIQYLITGIFYIIVTRTGALTQTDIGILSILDFIATTFCLFTALALPTALTKFASENLGKNRPEEAASIQRTITRTVIILSLAGFSTAALNNQDFELLRQAFPKPLAKYLSIIERIVVR